MLLWQQTVQLPTDWVPQEFLLFIFSLKENICPSPIFLFVPWEFSSFPGNAGPLF